MRSPLISLCCLVLAVPATGFAAPKPAVIELFQSQGCSSCPPANAVLNGLADRTDLITLSFSVTYWDYLGWKDSFAQKAFTARQYDYAHGMGRDNVATPQMVINGRGAITGQTRASVDQALKAFARTGVEPDISVTSGKVTVGAAPAGETATVWLVRYDPHSLDVPVSAGENTGRTLPHRHIVKQLIALGDWSGKPASFTLPAAPQGLQSAVLVQAGHGGRIVTATAF